METPEYLALAVKALDLSGESVVICDAQQRIVSVNATFRTTFGYASEEVVGQPAGMLASGQHNDHFYQSMWASVLDSGYWQGEIWDRRKNGEIFPGWLRLFAVTNNRHEPTHYIGIMTDISKRKRDEEQIEYLGRHDQLTGLPNRQLAIDRLKLALAYAQHAGRKVAILSIDIDNFKTINDSFGHSVGDKLLQAVAGSLRQCVRETDTVSRVGNDEFLVALANMGDSTSITRAIEKVQRALGTTFSIETHELSSSTSIGVVIYPDNGVEIGDLLRKVDAALAHAKKAGCNNHRFYTEEMNSSSAEFHRVRLGLTRALERGEFVLHYQPQVCLNTGAITGAEALIRWAHPEDGLLPPGAFIQTAEESGLIVQIGEWVIREACRQAAIWRADGFTDLIIAVNVSALQFQRGDIEAIARDALEQSGLPPECLELELTESILIDDPEAVLQTVRRLKAHGVKLSIDDFGTGYSSLAYLRRFDVDKLKIDRSFISDMLDEDNENVLVRAIIQMARSLNLKTIAEGVENEHVTTFLKLQYCDEAQGYFFARPMPANEFANFLKAKEAE